MPFVLEDSYSAPLNQLLDPLWQSNLLRTQNRLSHHIIPISNGITHITCARRHREANTHSCTATGGSSARLYAKKTIFRHPGYNPSINVLLALPCVDHASNVDGASSDPAAWGVHHRTALTACWIIANNAFDGYLALDAKGVSRVDETVGIDDVLTDRNYYFIVPGEDRYPVVPSFHDWKFPHESLPDFWPELPPAESPTGGSPCVITKYPWAVTKAHVVPSAQIEWFKMNSMRQYCTAAVPSIDGHDNLMFLKLDIHDCLDRFMFTLVPKPQAATEPRNRQEGNSLFYTVHVLANDQPLFTQLHHDIQLPDLQGVAREYLFARFALAIFMNVKGFITDGYKRRVARHRVANEDAGPEIVIEEVDGPELQRLYSGGKSRSASPAMRKRPGAEDEVDYEASTPELWGGSVDDLDLDSLDESIDEMSTDQWYRRRLEEQEEEERGRPKKRTRVPAHDADDGVTLTE